MFDAELESFKRDIDLRAYAAGQGFQLSGRESSHGSAVMRHPVSDDKIIIKRNTNSHYIYFSVRDDRDKGTIIDFVQFRQGLSIGAVRKELRPWLGKPPLPVPTFPVLHRTQADRGQVELAYARMQDVVSGHPYLERERALPASLLTDDRFAGRLRLEPCDVAIYPNAIFPHFDAKGLCGYEIKNVGFTGFAKAGTKALWLSHELPDDHRIVFGEAAIDVMSHAVLFPDIHARYASVGGKPNPEQPELIRAAIARMPLNGEVVAAMNADADGEKLNDVVRNAAALSGRLDLKFTVQTPVGQNDWNDILRAKPQPFLSYRPEVPSVA